MHSTEPTLVWFTESIKVVILYSKRGIKTCKNTQNKLVKLTYTITIQDKNGSKRNQQLQILQETLKGFWFRIYDSEAGTTFSFLKV